ncbi:MFS transporter [Pseudomonas sp. PDNC002]|uniref:spinster family MFS transporter n=1 Tax=Pseudomonas sp. PDNC002 TaxID=2811422 RepID=UPI001964C9DA|nr:MFS transporter [Pseudomonas sp. PDNC002]QRY79171.1 MFS transporter [Pseudomonas sp. PDNC002]
MNPQSPHPQSVRASRYSWYVVVLCMVAYIFSFVDRQILSLMIEPIKADLQISDTQFSLLSGLAFSLFYAFMGLPIAYLADRSSRVRIIAIGVAFWSIATAACGLSKNFLQMFLARMSVGVGEAALTPATYSMLADLFPREKLGRALGLYSMGAFLGGGLAFLVGGYVIEALRDVPAIDLGWLGQVRSWQIAFFIVGLPGVLVALLIALTIRDPARKLADSEKKATVRDGLRFLRRHRATFTCHYLGFSFFAMCQYALMGWAPAMYIRQYGLTPLEVGYILGGILLVLNTAGVFCAGWLVDVLQKRGRSDAALISGMLGAACTIPFVIGAVLAGDLTLSVLFMGPAMFFCAFCISTSAAAMQVLTPNRLRAQVSALFLLVSNLIGLGVGTTLVALLTDHYFKDPKAVGSSIGIIVTLAGLLCLWLLGNGRKHFRRSLGQEQTAQPDTAATLNSNAAAAN